ncbi:isoamyl acetate-hydrolyzing esterase [Coemansia sp. RSA 2611]|nr:isoamyl acetate-hydrolyzing esterase [Coemansia sp. RSA 2611]
MLVFGDSITQFGNSVDRGGFVARLANYYQRQMDVINRGFSQYNASGALGIAGNVFPKTASPVYSRSAAPAKSKPSSALWPLRDSNFPKSSSKLQLCILFFGTNDALAPSHPRANPIDSYYHAMHSLVALLRDSNSKHYSPETRIIIVTPPPVGELMLAEPTLTNARTSAYAQMAKRVATEVGAPYVDVFAEIQAHVKQDQANGNVTGEYDGYDKYLGDGIHPNFHGNSVIYELIMSTIGSKWPELVLQTPPS